MTSNTSTNTVNGLNFSSNNTITIFQQYINKQLVSFEISEDKKEIHFIYKADKLYTTNLDISTKMIFKDIYYINENQEITFKENVHGEYIPPKYISEEFIFDK